ncbi:MAG: sortase [Dehalococcoidia bacterium]|nr:sortase [Dehalococcoidia bacterium]
MVAVSKDNPASRAIWTWGKGRWFPLSMITLGLLLLGLVCGYYLYSVIARAQLEELEYTVLLDETNQMGGFSTIYPGNLVPPLSWNDPRWMDVDDDSYASLFEGFTPIDGNGMSAETAGVTAPTRIDIPSIGLSSTVKELKVVNYGDARGWETPKDVVGHISATSNPGEAGTGYLFGHFQSPIRGEGSIFRNLAKIPDLLRMGRDVYVVLYNEEDTEFLYRVSQTTVIPQEDFTLQASLDSTITMVACVPAYIYDQRLLVTAKLVGVKG